MKKIINFDKWNRKDLFNHYDICTNPFMIVSTEIDITNVYNYAKEYNLSMYASFGFYILNTINSFDGFKYRKEDDKLVLFDKVNANFTDSIDGKDIFFFSVEANDDLISFNNDYRTIKSNYIENNKKYVEKKYNINEVWLSCTPWFSFSSVTPPYNHDNYIPQFIWDKFKKCDNKVTTNLMVMVHHGFMDGYQLGKFFNELQNNIDQIKNSNKC